MSSSDVAAILVQLREMERAANDHNTHLMKWREHVDTLLKTHTDELMKLSSRQDETDYKIRRLAENAMIAPRTWSMAALCASFAGLAAFAAVVIGQLIHH